MGAVYGTGWQSVWVKNMGERHVELGGSKENGLGNCGNGEKRSMGQRQWSLHKELH